MKLESKVGKGEIHFGTNSCPDLLLFKDNGDVVYKGNVIGTDPEILKALRAAFFEFRDGMLCEKCGEKVFTK